MTDSFFTSAQKKRKDCKNSQELWDLSLDPELGKLNRNLAVLNKFELFFKEEKEPDWIIHLIDIMDESNIGWASMVITRSFLCYPDKNDLLYYFLTKKTSLENNQLLIKTIFCAPYYSRETIIDLSNKYEELVVRRIFNQQLLSDNLPIFLIDKIIQTAYSQNDGKNNCNLYELLYSSIAIGDERMLQIINFCRKNNKKVTFKTLMNSPNVSFDVLIKSGVLDDLGKNLNYEQYLALSKLSKIFTPHQKLIMVKIFPSLSGIDFDYNDSDIAIEVLS